MQSIVIIEQVLNGLLIGTYYLLVALGLSLIFSFCGVVNLAHGAFYAIGAYLAVRLTPHIGIAGSFVAVPVFVALLGIALERLLSCFHRADPVLTLLLTFGLAMVAEQALRAVFGASPLLYAAPAGLQDDIRLGHFAFSEYRLVMLAAAVVAITLAWFLIHRTPFGRVVRAGAQNPEMVGALGISLAPYRIVVAALGVGLAGLAGALLGPIVAIEPAMGDHILTAAFVVVAIGGLGSFRGIVAAALLVGVVRGLAAYALPGAAEGSMYLLLLLSLLFRPRGLFGERPAFG